MARGLFVEVFLDASNYVRGLRESAAATSKFEKEVQTMQGRVKESGAAFKSVGKSVAFMSAGFLGFEGASKMLHDTVEATREAQMANRSLAAQMKASGESFSDNKDRIEESARSLTKYGFNADQAVQALTILERGTHNIDRALGLQQLTADIAAAKQIDLASAAQAVAKVFGGQETALRRAVPGLSKTAHGMDLITQAERKMAGQAAANSDALSEFHANIHNLEEQLGTGLLPVLKKVTGAFNDFFEAMKGPNTLEMQNPVEDTLVPQLAKRIARMRASGMNTKDILTSLKRSPQFAGGSIWNEIISEALRFDKDPALQARLKQQAAQELAQAQGALSAAAKAHPLTLGGQFNIQELRLAQAQLTKTTADDRRVLVVEKGILEAQIAQASTLKDKTALTQQLVGIQNQIQAIDQQNLATKKAQTAELQKQAQARKTEAEAIKQATLAQLQNRQTRNRDQQAIADAKDALHTAQLLGGRTGIRHAAAALQDARLQALIDRLSAAPARLTKGGQFSLGTVVTVNVHGVTDPAKVAKQVVEIIQRRARHTTTQMRGPAAGTAQGQH